MAELTPIPFPDLVRRMRREVGATQAIFDLPVKKWWIPDPELDFGANHFHRRAATPVGRRQHPGGGQPEGARPDRAASARAVGVR